MLANKKKKVLLVDCDPQCNLTGMFLGFTGIEDIEAYYKKDGIRNIRDGLAPAFESKPVPLKPVTCESMKGQKNLFLLPGSIRLAEYETTLGIAQELSGSLVTLQNLPGSISHLLEITAKQYKIDIIIVDMSPSLGPINQNILATSDFFLVPMAPDYFSVMATDSLASVLPKWKDWLERALANSIFKSATYPLPDRNPRFLGTIVQKYRLRSSGNASNAFQKWIDEIQKKVHEVLLPALELKGMLLPQDVYDKLGMSASRPILQMSDFNGLIAQSQKYSTPVFALSDQQLEQTGIILERTKKSMKQFEALFSDAADRVITLINYDKA